MRRQKLHLSVRADTDAKMEQVAGLVGQALGCAFAEGEYQRWYAQVAQVFGLKLSLVPVRGVDGKNVAKLVGSVAEKGFLFAPDGSDDVEYDRVDISAYLVDLLTMRTGLQWYRPTAEDLAAENRAIAAFDDWIGQAGPRTTIDDEEEFPGRPRFGRPPER